MIKKTYVKSRKVAKVTFEMPKDELPQDLQVKSLHLVGDFNSWDSAATPMKRVKGGAYRLTLELEPGREYRFRYLANGEHWCNDWHADGYTPGAFGEDDCIVYTPSSAEEAA